MSGIYDITPFSLLDFPDIPSAIIWFAGCNLRCRYCYNPDIVLGEGRVSESSVLNILSKRVGLLEGVVLSGGEATLYSNIINFSGEIRKMGYKIKLDTNGMRPDIVDTLIRNHLLDYIALDYKAPDIKMKNICGGGKESRFWKTFDVLKASGIPYEVRTTFHPDLLSHEDVMYMSSKLREAGYENAFYLQNFKRGIPTLGEISDPQWSIDHSALENYVTFRS